MADKLSQNKKYNKIIGIEISENDIHACEVQFVKDKVYITNGFNLNTPVFQDLNKTVSFIRQNVRYLNFKVKNVVVGLSMQYFKLFPVAIPTTIPQDEINSIILQEGNINPQEELLSWIPLNNTKRQEPDGITRIDVLGISIKKSVFEATQAIIKKTGLNLISITPSFLGLGCFLNPQVSANLTSTLWISQLKSELVVWSGQEPIYEHLFLTHTIQDHLFQSVNHIQTSIPGAQITTVFTSGPFVKEINLSPLPYNFQQILLPSDFLDGGNVFQRLTVPEIIVSLGLALAASNNVLYTVPNLLAHSRFEPKNLKSIFKKPSTQKKEFKLPFNIGGKQLDPLFSKYVVASILVFLISIVLNFLIQTFLTPQVQANLNSYQSRLSFAQAHLARVLNYEKFNKTLNIKINYFENLIDKRKPWSQILKELAKMSPKELWIDRLEVRGNNVDIFGRSLNVDAIANFSINLNYTAKNLEKSQIIALKKSQEEGVDIIEFQLSAQVKQKNKKLQEEKITIQTKSQKMTL